MSSAGSSDVLGRAFLFCAGMLSALLLIGCSEEDPAGIDFNNVLDGRWTYSVTGLELPDGRVCGLSSAVLDLEQDGMHFDGSATGGTTTCIGADGEELPPEDLSGDMVRNGFFDGDSVSYEVYDIFNHGEFRDDRMEGVVGLESDSQQATSTFEAVRVGT
ncbi:MAG: hypothetical protein ACREMD_03635 [Gemmatimonadota bacterium]